SLKTSIKTITYLSDTGCLEIQGASLLTFRFSQLITDRLFILTGSPVRPVSLLQFSIVIAVISSGNEARTPCHNFLYADNHFPVHLPVAGT
ncbi:hypothetical protein ACNIV9_23345, partial [Escherichia coli]